MLYVLGVAKPFCLFALAVIHTSYFAVENSNGAVQHIGQLYSLFFLTQFLWLEFLLLLPVNGLRQTCRYSWCFVRNQMIPFYHKCVGGKKGRVFDWILSSRSVGKDGYQCNDEVSFLLSFLSSYFLFFSPFSLSSLCALLSSRF